jgi:hypothetical protein
MPVPDDLQPSFTMPALHLHKFLEFEVLLLSLQFRLFFVGDLCCNRTFSLDIQRICMMEAAKLRLVQLHVNAKDNSVFVMLNVTNVSMALQVKYVDVGAIAIAHFKPSYPYLLTLVTSWPADYSHH